MASPATAPITTGEGLRKFVGTWKRTTNSFAFGPFLRGKDATAVVMVELASADSLKWSFGTSVETVRHGYTLQLQTDASGGSKSWKRVAVTAIAGECSGTCKDDGSVIALQLTSQSLASIVYRLMDDDTIAVSITEVPEGRGGGTVQHGYMFRIA